MKPLNSPTQIHKRAYTLIELLVVICIISLLLAMTNSAITAVIAKAKVTRVKADLADLNLGIGQYAMERNRLPVPVDFKSEAALPLSKGSKVLAVLLGENPDQLNPSQTVWIKPKPGSNGAGGLVGEAGSYGYLDPWGEPYYVLLDTDYNQRISNPDRRNSDPNISSDCPSELFGQAQALSAGPDKQLHTKDDVVSWR
jgi:prepilin-type N-terminal cleavage/methylation domain-containing protein